MRISLCLRKAGAHETTWIAVAGDKDLVERVATTIKKEFKADKDITIE